MSVRLAGIAPFAFAAALLHCSLVVDTDGLSGGPADAAPSSDGPIVVNESGVDAGPDAPASSGTFATTWLAYGKVSGAVQVRAWNNESASWSTEQPGPSVGAPVRWVVPKETPEGSFLAVVSGDTSVKLDVFHRAPDGGWILGFSQPMAVVNRRAFDITYETNSHAVLVVYGDATAQVKARRFSGGTWSAETALKNGGTVAPQWLELAHNPATNEATLTYADDGSNLFTVRWDGQTWGDNEALEGFLNTLDWKCFASAYENTTGKLVITWGYDEGEGAGFSAKFVTRPIGGALGNVEIAVPDRKPGPMVLVPEPGTNRLLFSYVEYSCNENDLECDDFTGAIWDGTKFLAAPIDENSLTLYRSRPSTSVIGAAWLGTTGHAISAYHRELVKPGELAYSYFRGIDWTEMRGVPAEPAIGPRSSMQLVTVPGTRVVALVQDTAGKLWSDSGGGGPLANGLLTPNAVPFGVAVP